MNGTVYREWQHPRNHDGTFRETGKPAAGRPSVTGFEPGSIEDGLSAEQRHKADQALRAASESRGRAAGAVAAMRLGARQGAKAGVEAAHRWQPAPGGTAALADEKIGLEYSTGAGEVWAESIKESVYQEEGRNPGEMTDEEMREWAEEHSHWRYAWISDGFTRERHKREFVDSYAVAFRQQREKHHSRNSPEPHLVNDDHRPVEHPRSLATADLHRHLVGSPMLKRAGTSSLISALLDGADTVAAYQAAAAAEQAKQAAQA